MKAKKISTSGNATQLIGHRVGLCTKRGTASEANIQFRKRRKVSGLQRIVGIEDPNSEGIKQKNASDTGGTSVRNQALQKKGTTNREKTEGTYGEV